MAKLPKELIERANEILCTYENKNNKKRVFTQTSLFMDEDEKKVEEDKLIKKLKELDPLNITPLQALNIIYELKDLTKEKKD